MNALPPRPRTDSIFLGLSALGVACGLGLLVTDVLAARALAKEPSDSPVAALRDSGTFAQRQTADEIFSIAFFVVVAMFLVWVFRRYKDFVRAGVPDLQRGPWWAVIDFLVPLVNLVLPFMVAEEIWSKSARLAGRPEHESKGRRYTLSWWLTCLGAIVLTRISEHRVGGALNAVDLGSAMQLTMLADLMRVAAVVLGAVLVAKVARFQPVVATPAVPEPATALS
ncbi:MAG TPA: DUF4328 domain-containing protein [Polyangia bacterium]